MPVRPQNLEEGDRPTEHQTRKAAVTAMECAAMRLLASDGWTHDELRMVFEVKSSTVNRHVNGRCKIHNVGGSSDA